MTLLSTLRRHLAGAFVCSLFALPTVAQDMQRPTISGADLRRALIWTGHYSVMNTGDPVAILRAASQSWQVSKKYKPTDELPDEQVAELLAEGDKQRDSFGWAKLEDKSIGFSIGVPTKLVKFLSARTENGNYWYDFEGGIRYTLGVRYGDVDCANIDQLFARVMRGNRPG